MLSRIPVQVIEELDLDATCGVLLDFDPQKRSHVIQHTSCSWKDNKETHINSLCIEIYHSCGLWTLSNDFAAHIYWSSKQG